MADKKKAEDVAFTGPELGVGAVNGVSEAKGSVSEDTGVYLVADFWGQMEKGRQLLIAGCTGMKFSMNAYA
jgi:hypothetical protein